MLKINPGMNAYALFDTAIRRCGVGRARHQGRAIAATGRHANRPAADFNRDVYAIGRSIPPGRTLTYGDIARRLGDVA